jgi:hypothetical protein
MGMDSTKFGKDFFTAWDPAGEEEGSWDLGFLSWEFRFRARRQRSYVSRKCVQIWLGFSSSPGSVPLLIIVPNSPHSFLMTLAADLRNTSLQVFDECASPLLDCKLHEGRAHGICLAHQHNLASWYSP